MTTTTAVAADTTATIKPRADRQAQAGGCRKRQRPLARVAFFLRGNVRCRAESPLGRGALHGFAGQHDRLLRRLPGLDIGPLRRFLNEIDPTAGLA